MILAKRETQTGSHQVNHLNLLQQGAGWGVLFWDELRSTLPELRRQRLWPLPTEMVGFQRRMEQRRMAYEMCLGTHTQFTVTWVSQVQAASMRPTDISFQAENKLMKQKVLHHWRILELWPRTSEESSLSTQYVQVDSSNIDTPYGMEQP